MNAYVGVIAAACTAAVLAGCSGPAEEAPALPQPAPAPGAPEVVVSQQRVAPSGTMELRATGFAPSTDVDIGVGLPESEYTVIRTIRTDASGSASVSVTLPDWLERGRAYVAVAAAGETKAVSAPFLAAEAGDDVTIRGTLVEGGVECRALRGRDGVLYTLAAATIDHPNGTEVIVEGEIAGMSTCMQGVVISVDTIRHQ